MAAAARDRACPRPGGGARAAAARGRRGGEPSGGGGPERGRRPQGRGGCGTTTRVRRSRWPKGRSPDWPARRAGRRTARSAAPAAVRAGRGGGDHRRWAGRGVRRSVRDRSGQGIPRPPGRAAVRHRHLGHDQDCRRGAERGRRGRDVCGGAPARRPAGRRRPGHGDDRRHGQPDQPARPAARPRGQGGRRCWAPDCSGRDRPRWSARPLGSLPTRPGRAVHARRLRRQCPRGRPGHRGDRSAAPGAGDDHRRRGRPSTWPASRSASPPSSSALRGCGRLDQLGRPPTTPAQAGRG